MPEASSPTVGTIGIVAVGRATFDLEAAAALVTTAVGDLDEAGWTCEPPAPSIVTDLAEVDAAFSTAAAGRPDAVVVLQATFADATMAIRLDELARTAGVPLVVWSFPEARTGERLRLNALCGANLAAFSLRRRRSDAAFVHQAPADGAGAVAVAIGDAARRLRRTWPDVAPVDETVAGETRARARAVAARVADATIGVIGDHPVGFEPCAYDRDEVEELTGATVDRVELGDLFGAADAVTPVRLARIRERVAANAVLDPGLEEVGLEQSLRLYGGLHALSDRRSWKAVATRCWPECPRGYGGAACAAQGMLADDGIPAMCEADLAGAITALVLRELAHADPFVADVVDLDADEGTSAIWHCGQAPTSLAAPGERLRGTVHPNTHRALIHEFSLAPGPVTVARLTQAGPDAGRRWALVVGAGELVEAERPFAGTCGVLRWERPAEEVVGTILDYGLEHHVAVVPGEHRDVLVALAAEWGLPVLRLGEDRLDRDDAAVGAHAALR